VLAEVSNLKSFLRKIETYNEGENSMREIIDAWSSNDEFRILKGDKLSSDLCNRCAYEAWRRLLKDLKKPERVTRRE
jgi:hypothetical protein